MKAKDYIDPETRNYVVRIEDWKLIPVPCGEGRTGRNAIEPGTKLVMKELSLISRRSVRGSWSFIPSAESKCY